MKRRRGSTLLEVIALMIGVSVMLALAITSIQALVSVERANRKEAATALRVDRLAESFRRDVHRAKAWKLTEIQGQSTLTLDLGEGRTTVYATTPEGVDVTSQTAGEAPSRRERFPMPNHRAALSEIPAQADAPARPRLTIARAVGQPDALALRVEPIPGREVPR